MTETKKFIFVFGSSLLLATFFVAIFIFSVKTDSVFAQTEEASSTPSGGEQDSPSYEYSISIGTSTYQNLKYTTTTTGNDNPNLYCNVYIFTPNGDGVISMINAEQPGGYRTGSTYCNGTSELGSFIPSSTLDGLDAGDGYGLFYLDNYAAPAIQTVNVSCGATSTYTNCITDMSDYGTSTLFNYLDAEVATSTSSSTIESDLQYVTYYWLITLFFFVSAYITYRILR